MQKLAARVRARRAKESQKERVAATVAAAEASSPAAESAPTNAAEIARRDEAYDPEPSNAELEEAVKGTGNGSKRVGPAEVTFKADVRSHRDGAAKRPQPQNKPRSQRKK